jgi:hypothetical protein
MSDPRYTVTRRFAATPEVVLAAIRDAVTAGRRGTLPVRRLKGTRGVGGKVRGERFTVWPDRIWEGDTIELAGMVIPTDAGGSEVRASVLDDRNAPTQVLVLLVSTVVLVLTGNVEIAWFGVCFTALAAINAFRSAKGAINHDEAAFLQAWLNAVLDPLAASPPSDPARVDADPAATAASS